MSPFKAIAIAGLGVFLVILFVAGLIQMDYNSRKVILNSYNQLKLDIQELQQFTRGSQVYHLEYGNGKRWIECTTKPQLKERRTE